MENDIYQAEFVRGLFDRMSPTYERVNYLTSFGFSIRWRRQFLDRIPATEQPLEILDLMTGMGETWGATLTRFPKARLTALDFSAGMLKHAEVRNREHHQQRVQVLQQDALSNNLPSAHYDVVTCAFGLKTFNAEQLRALANETYRILKPGGWVSFVEVSEPHGTLLRTCYGFYLTRVIPVLGRLLLGDAQEYRMLGRYTAAFGDAREATRIFNDAGLQVEPITYFYGCATGFVGVRRP